MKEISDIRVRFAPRVTEPLYIGNARIALFNWLYARKNNGSFILRMGDVGKNRDTDRENERFKQTIFEGMRWLGLELDEGPDKGGEFGPYRQSLRKNVYEKYFQELKAKGCIYPCYCDQKDLEHEEEKALSEGKPYIYNNKCRSLTSIEINKFENAGQKPNWRFKVTDEKIVIKDIIQGKINFDTDRIGDFIIVNQGGSPAYCFADCADDISMKITHAIIGEDRLPSTARQFLISKALGRELPVLAHVGVVTGSEGSPLDGKNKDFSIAEYRRLGYLPEGILNYLALLGWLKGIGKKCFPIRELIDSFAIKDLSKGQCIYNKKKLDSVNACYIKDMDGARLTDLCIPYIKKSNLVKGPIAEKKYSLLNNILNLSKGHMSNLAECINYTKIFLSDTIDLSVCSEKDILNESYVKELLKTLYGEISKLDDVTPDNIKEIFTDTQKKLKIKDDKFYLPVRLVLTGMTDGPDLDQIIPLMGKDRVLKRLNSNTSNLLTKG